jgi:hypothetical protein
VTSLTVQNGSLVLRGTALGTGQGCCCGPSGEACDYLSCVTWEWDLEYLSWPDWTADPSVETWLPSSGTATVRCASESRQLITLSLSSCFGSGAIGNVWAPVGYERSSMGPITAAGTLYNPALPGVTLPNGGSGYAKLARVAPTLTVSGGSGAGLTVTPTLASTNDACGIPTWKIASVTFSGGTGYANGETLTVSTKAGDTTVSGAVLTVQTDQRSQPTLTASVSGGTGATLTPTLAANGTTPQTWGVASVSVSGTTSGYTDGAAVTFSYGANVTEQAAAVATVKTARATPTITASVSGGSGASLTVNLSQSPTTPSDTALWHVDSVTVADGGTGYANGDPVTFTVTDGTQVTAASGTIATDAGRENPNLTPYVWGVDGTTGGSGAVLSATMVSNEDDPETWGVAAINVIDGGSGYEVGEYFWYSEFGTGFASIPPYYLVETDGWLITSVDGNGAITGVGLDGYGGIGKFYKATGNGVIQSVTITGGGDYYKATTSIARVVVTNGGQYYYYTGIPTGVTVTSGGAYYREDASLPPYVADVTVTINQLMPSEGTGAELSAVIDTDTGSATFGQITGINIDNAGDGYLAQRTAHPDALRLTCLDANGTQDEDLPPDGVRYYEWQMPTGSEPSIWLGFFGGVGESDCCYYSFLTAPDYGFTSPSGGGGAPVGSVAWPGGWTNPSAGYYEYIEEGGSTVLIRGTITRTITPIWFAEDCECANPLP